MTLSGGTRDWPKGRDLRSVVSEGRSRSLGFRGFESHPPHLIAIEGLKLSTQNKSVRMDI